MPLQYLQVKKWRVIVRNLPFGVTPDDLRQLLRPVGFVWATYIPTDGAGKMKGFGFLTFTCRSHAAAAIEAMNGKVCLLHTALRPTIAYGLHRTFSGRS